MSRRPVPIRVRVLALLAAALVVAPFVAAGHSPDPATYWFTRINVTHADPTGMTVVVVPQAYFSVADNVQQTGWVNADLLDDPGVRAALEATSYWAWMIDRSASTYPALAHLSYTTKVLGVDATPADLAEADIVVNTAFTPESLGIFSFHLGLGLPTTPVGVFSPVTFGGSIGEQIPLPVDQGQEVCTVWNTGIGSVGEESTLLRLRNLILHEFGHCLGAGHVGESQIPNVSNPHTNAEGVVYDDHPTDILSVALGEEQCLSNANMLSLAEGYAWTLTTGVWEQHDAEAYIAKSAYRQTCIPDALRRV